MAIIIKTPSKGRKPPRNAPASNRSVTLLRSRFRLGQYFTKAPGLNADQIAIPARESLPTASIAGTDQGA